MPATVRYCPRPLPKDSDSGSSQGEKYVTSMLSRFFCAVRVSGASLCMTARRRSSSSFSSSVRIFRSLYRTSFAAMRPPNPASASKGGRWIERPAYHGGVCPGGRFRHSGSLPAWKYFLYLYIVDLYFAMKQTCCCAPFSNTASACALVCRNLCSVDGEQNSAHAL